MILMPRGGARKGSGRKALYGAPLDDCYQLRYLPEERKLWDQAAAREGKPLAAWIRDTLNDKAKQIKQV